MAPLSFVIPDQYLIVQPVRLSVHGQHVLRKPEQVRDALNSQIPKLVRQSERWLVIPCSGEHESPFSE
jgi:hypothetical protein